MLGFRMPTRVHIMPGSLPRLPEAARSLYLQSCLLVVDPGLEATPWPEQVTEALEAVGMRFEVFDSVEVNPRTTTAQKAAEVLRDKELDGVIGLGGGSVLDTAKAAAMLARNEGQAEHYEGSGRYSRPPLPFLAVPTTCGTGSEVTWVAVLNLEATRTKISIKGESMFPDIALVDSDLIRTLPPALVASTALDALTHAVEATTCRLSNPVSDSLAEKAIALIFAFLPRAVADVAGDAEAREAVMRAATLAGLAFGNADVAGVHCLSEALGGLFDVPHGVANAVLLGPVMRYHRPEIEKRLAALEKMLVRASDDAPAGERADRFLQRIDDLVDELGIPAFSSLGIPAGERCEIARRAARNGSNPSNPQPMAARDYEKILAPLMA